MKVLVTGGCGFLGSHVCELFKEKGWEVVAYDNLSKHELIRTGYNIEATRDYNLNFLRSLGILVQKADVRSLDTLLECTRGCDYIVHTAAQPAMTIALEQPLFDCASNVVGTLNVLEVARRLHIPAAICSTIHVYGNDINNHLVEEDETFSFKYSPRGINEDYFPLLRGTVTPLHVSKRAAELYAQAYIDSYDTRVAIFRLTGIYGPRQLGGEDHGWVANFAIRTVLGLPIKVFGTDKQVRDILYVRDAACAFHDWYSAGSLPGLYNVGGGELCVTSIRQCLRMLSEIIGKKQSVSILPVRSGDLWYFCCDVTKAKKTFGWQPSTLPFEGTTRLVEWIKENRELFQ